MASFLYFRYADLTSPAIRKSWVKVEEGYLSADAFVALVTDLRALSELTQSRGARLVVLVFPDTSAPWDQYRYRDFHRKFGEYLNLTGVTTIDLLPVLERHPPESLHVSFMDTHPNELAHRLAATELTGALERMFGFPAPTPAPR